jgi:hypothetical protein
MTHPTTPRHEARKPPKHDEWDNYYRCCSGPPRNIVINSSALWAPADTARLIAWLKRALAWQRQGGRK